MTLQEVEAIWADTLEKVKPYLQDGHIVPNVKGSGKYSPGMPELPELWPGYEVSVNDARSLAIHIDRGADPSTLMLERTPNQSEEEYKYVRNNFKQTTLPVFKDYENTLRRSMHDMNWSLEWMENEGAKQFSEYATTGLPEYDSVVNYWKMVVPKIKTADPMGVLVTMPSEVPVVDGEGGPVIDPDRMLEPEFHYFSVDRVWGYKVDKYYLVRKYENSNVTYGTATKNVGLVCWLIDDEYAWRIEQTGKLVDWTFSITMELRHGVGYPPATHLLGDPVTHEGKIVWQSPYMSIKDLLDIALMDAQYLQVSKNTTAYPYRVMIGDDCDFVDQTNGVPCSNGTLVYASEDPAKPYDMQTINCPACKGTGLKSRVSPTGTLILRARTSTKEAEVADVTKAMTFVNPERSVMDFMREEIERNDRRARAIMHIDSDRALMDGGEADTATKVGLDHKASIAFREPIVHQMFFLLDFMLDTASKMRHGEGEYYTLTRPTNLDIRTVDDLLAELEAAHKANMPPAVIDQIVWAFVSGRYQSDPKAMTAFEVIAQADRLLSMGHQQITTGLGNGTIEPWESVLHYSATFLYDQLARDKKFAALDLDAKVEAMKAAAREKAPQAPRSPLEIVRSNIENRAS